jgi:hypothetical protein
LTISSVSGNLIHFQVCFLQKLKEARVDVKKWRGKILIKSESCCYPVKAENPCFLPSTQLLTPQQFQKNTQTKNEIKTPNQQIKQPNK